MTTKQEAKELEVEYAEWKAALAENDMVIKYDDKGNYIGGNDNG